MIEAPFFHLLDFAILYQRSTPLDQLLDVRHNGK